MDSIDSPPTEDNAIDIAALRAALARGSCFRRLYWLEETDSTTRRAAALLAAEPAATGMLVLARRQWDGRGRRGRQWLSPEGGLWFSLAWTPAIPRRQWPLLSLLAAVAALEALRPYYPALTLKWPNDVYGGGRKLVGIALETAGDDLIAGIGVNVNNPMRTAGEDLNAVSLAELSGRTVALTPLLLALVRGVEERLQELGRDGPAALLEAYRRYCGHLGQSCAVRRGEIWRRGVCVDIDDQGRLLLDCDGNTERIDAGEIFIMEREDTLCT